MRGEGLESQVGLNIVGVRRVPGISFERKCLHSCKDELIVNVSSVARDRVGEQKVGG